MFGAKKTQPRPAMGLYTVYDRVAEEAGPCFLAVNDGVAVRAYRNLVKQEGVVSEDEYILYRVGSYESKSMEVRGEEPVRVVVPPIMDDLLQPKLPGVEVVNVQ